MFSALKARVTTAIKGAFTEVTGTAGAGNKFAIDVNDISRYQRTSYNVLETITNHSYVTASPVYNLLPANFRTFTSGTGSATTENREFKVSTGTTIYGYGAIQSFRSLAFEYGQTGLCRFAARFPIPVPNSWQGCGLISITDELSFGYNGLEFGAWYRHGGEVEVRTLTLTVAAAGAETATVTYNGTSINISISALNTATNAYTIATALNADGTFSAGYAAEQLGSTVVISSLSDGAKDSTWSYSSTGSSAGSFTRTTAGVTKTSDHTPLTEFNGSVPTGFDPKRGNQYSISYSAGYADIEYRIFDFNLNRYVLAHTIQNLSEAQVPTLNNPSMKCGLYVASVGSTTNIDAYCGFIAGVTQGEQDVTRNPRAFKSTKNIATTLTNLMTIRNKRIYNGVPNQVEIEPLSLTVTNEANKALIVEVRAQATVAGPTNFTNVGTNLVSEYDTTGTTVTEGSGTPLAAFTVAQSGGQIVIDLKELSIRIPPTLRLVIAAKVISGAGGDVTASLVWREDI